MRIGTALLAAAAAWGVAPAQEPFPPRRAEIRAQTRGLLAARLKADVGLTDAQITEVLPRIESTEDARRQSRRERARLLSGLRRDINAEASDTALQASLDALDRNEREEDRAAREGLARIDATLSVPQRVRLRFLLARLRGDFSRQIEMLRESRRGAR
jgi:hypothetical protein